MMRNRIRIFYQAALLTSALLCSHAHAFETESLANLSRDDVRVISDADLSQVLEAVLTHKSVAMYLHPEVPGRVPVMIAIGKPYSYQPVQFSLYGKPVVITTNPKDLKTAVKLKPICSAHLCKVEVGYKPEGIFGTAELMKDGKVWKVTRVDIYE